jgi:hypothetical protein
MTPADRARLECQRQGIPFAITDRATIERIAAVLHQVAAPADGTPPDAGPGHDVLRVRQAGSVR